ncbi:DUF3305 domain-containing protein [Thiosocius teredinicola]|uniref:DUF3305 domain-containing protein n=1 Tax=Thiosocius teredinicola TaxID=1973002 RepID=UPI0013DDA3E5
MPNDATEPDRLAAGFPVAVMMERRPATSPWVDHVWKAVAITVGRHAQGGAMSLVRDDGETALFLVGGLQVRLHVDECESYYHNMVCGTPRAYVVAHPAADINGAPRPFIVSLSFDEAHAYLEGEDEIYDVDIPPELYRWTEAFVVENYFPEKKVKRKLQDWRAQDGGKRA